MPGPLVRPFGVSVIAALALISGAIDVSLGVLAVLVLFVGQVSAEVGSGLVLGVIGTVTLAFAWGAWSLRRWAWPLGIILWSVSLIQAVIVLPDGEMNSNLVVAPICLVYLLRHRVRGLFRR